MMLEIARFWASIAHFNPDRDRYEIHGVMGPDEFHERYPEELHGSFPNGQGGIRNNAYTNVLVAWICETAQAVLGLLPESRREGLRARIGLTDEEIARWGEMSRKMFVPFHGDGIISQFEGYEHLRELDWDAYRAKYEGNIQRLDRILRAEGDDPDRYQLAKQADTVMLFFLFPDEELRRLFERLGYDYAPDTARKTIDYYDQRTSHGSTLSFITHAAVLAALDPESSWERFLIALESDVGDVQGGTTKEGIHMGVMSGHARPDPARLRRQRHPRRGPVLRTASDGSTRRALVPDAVPRHAAPGEPDAGRAHGRRRVRGLQPADTGRRGRRCPRVVRRRPVQLLALTEGSTDGDRVPGGDLRCRRRARRLAARGGVARGVARAHGNAVERRPGRDARMPPERFTPQVYQQVMSGKPRFSGAQAALEYFDVPDAERRSRDYGDRKQTMVIELIDQGRVHGLPRRAAVRSGGEGGRDPHGRGIVVEERRIVPAPDPARHVRRGGGARLRLRHAWPEPARLL